MKRFFTEYLINWKNRNHRKPLIVRGARQVGKTYTIDDFGKNNFKEIIKINFEEKPELKTTFQTNNTKEIIQNLEIYFEKEIIPQETLIFIDEIQICPKAIVSLRYFYENEPNLHIIAAGSLLDHTLNNLQYSMPVGRVEFAYMHPLSFYEFLLALKNEKLVSFLKNYTLEKEIPQAIHQKLLKFIRLYFFIGGMPEAVKVYSETQSLTDIERIHESIVKSFEFDFSKYGTRSQQNIMAKLLRYIPKVSGQKFKYVNFDNNLRSNAIKTALDLLNLSRIVHLTHSTKESKSPLEFGKNTKVFKTFFLDIGLANHIMKLRLTEIDNLQTNNEGNLAEQFVGQELLCFPPDYIEHETFYWVREKRNSEAEIDYLTEFNNKIIPIEVKAGKTGSLKSLQVFVSEKNIKKAVRFNADFPSKMQINTSIKINNGMKNVDFELISLPFYLVSEFERLAK